MPNGLIPRDFWIFPNAVPSVFEDIIEETRLDTIPSGLSVSEDDKNVYVEAALPGIDPKDVEVIFEKGVLRVRGESKEEERKGRKFYRKATKAFSYSLTVPGEVDPKEAPDATYKNGMMNIVFKKAPEYRPKKIAVKAV